MYYLYRIDSRYDGFAPTKISSKVKEGYITYNWNQYFDEISKGDYVFTYFINQKTENGIYLVSKVVKKSNGNQVKARVLIWDEKKPLLGKDEFERIRKDVLNRPRGSVFAIPAFTKSVFNAVLRGQVPEKAISDDIDCILCAKKRIYSCNTCSIFTRDYPIDWQKEVQLIIKGYKTEVSPFWIIPRQSYWMNTSISKHNISRYFYDFKSGVTLYNHLFASGIKKALDNDSRFAGVKFDCILGVPLSPKKKKNREVDRVKAICKILSDLTGIAYMPSVLSLSAHISRKEYRHDNTTTAFMKNYYRNLRIAPRASLNNKNVLVVDDVITDGKTLQSIGKKIKDQYPDCNLFAAACGIFLKKQNASPFAVKKFKR